MDLLIAALHAAAMNNLLVTLLLMATLTSIFVLLEPRWPWLGALVLVALLAFANLFFGRRLVAALIVRNGVAGTGMVVAMEASDRHYNGGAVMRYQALIRSSDGHVVESTFDDVGMMFQPSLRSGDPVPQPGIEFSVRHLPARPQVFVIVTDDHSAYAHGLRCRGLAGAINAARRKRDFGWESADYRNAYAVTQEAFARAGCDAAGGGRMAASSSRQAETAR